MSSWGNNDNSANAPLWAAMTVNLKPDAANQTSLFDNTTANNVAVTLGDGSVRQGRKTVGVFGVDAQESGAEHGAAHTGWVLRTTGQGGRAGRVQEEVLVAMSSFFGDADGQSFANVSIVLSGPSNASVVAGGGNTVTFTTTPTLSGNTSATLTYQWQVDNANGSLGWTNVANNTPANTTYVGGTTSALVVTPSTAANTYVYRVVVSAADQGVTATSANATITVA